MLNGWSAGGGGPSPRIIPRPGGTKAATSPGVGICANSNADADPNNTAAQAGVLFTRFILVSRERRSLLDGEVPRRRHIAAQLETGAAKHVVVVILVGQVGDLPDHRPLAVVRSIGDLA